jgi:hypothetical protein
VQRVIRPQPPGFFEQLMSSGGDDDSEQTNAEVKKQAALVAALPEDVRRTLRYMQLMDRAKHGEAIYMMPFDLRIR